MWNSKGKFSSRYESAAGCEDGRVYSQSLRLDNMPLACYNDEPTCVTTLRETSRCNKIVATLRAMDLQSYSYLQTKRGEFS